jgi:dienelactone hydrolase
MKVVDQALTLEKDGVAGHISYPVREEPGPALVLLHSVTGRIGYLKIEARKFAKLGYTTFVPSLYPPLGAPAVPNIELGSKIQAETSDAQFMSIIGDCWDFVRQRPDVDNDRAAVGGYCMGSRLGILFAAEQPEVRAFVGYYPTVHDAPRTELRPKMPWEAAVEMRCPSIIVYGALDSVTTVPIQQRMWAAFLQNEQRLDWHFVSTGTHGFVDPDSGNYEAYSAEITFPLVAEFLSRELGGESE